MYVITGVPQEHLLRSNGEETRPCPHRDETSAIAAHWITLVAWIRRVGGIGRPSAWAVLKLITSSNLVGCSTGMSPGFTPRRILFTKSAARRYKSAMLTP